MKTGSDWSLKFRMFFVMVLLGVVAIGFGSLVGIYFNSIGVAIVVVLLMTAVQFFLGDKIALKSFGAKEVSPEEYPELHSMVSRVAQQADIPKPTVAVADMRMQNAFATGHSQRSSTVCVTTGLMDSLNEEELEGVIAHEVAHIKNRDVIVMTAASVLTAVTGFVLRWGFLFGGNGRRNNGYLVIILASVVTYIVSFLLIRALSRYREFAADKGAATITGKPQALSSALRKIDSSADSVPEEDLRNARGTGQLMISPVKGKLSNLLSTHPKTEKRIKRLQEMSEN